MDSIEERTKTRRLSTYEFFEIIQIEYICSILRARIYPKSKDKEYWNRVAEGKRQTIEKISQRNSQLPNIFTDSDLESALSRRIYRETTYPIFVYKDDTQRLSQEYLDLLYYYAIGSDVRYDIGNGLEVGVVVEYQPFKDYVTIKPSRQEEPVRVSVGKVARIL